SPIAQRRRFMPSAGCLIHASERISGSGLHPPMDDSSGPGQKRLADRARGCDAKSEMLKRAAIAVIVLASATGALADAQTECDSEDGSPDQAIIACSQVIRVDPRAAWAYFKRGNAHQVKGGRDR